MSSGSPLDFGPLTSIVGFRLRAAQLVIYEDFLRGAPVAGLTPGQFAILLLVEHNPGLTQQSLSDGIHIEKSTLVVRLHRLEERGLLRRVRSSNDRRSNVLEVTAEGKKCLRIMLSFVRAHEDRLLSELSATERQQLLKLLGKIVLAGRRVQRTGPRGPAANGGHDGKSPSAASRRTRAGQRTKSV